MNPEKCTGNHHPKWFGLALQALVILSKERIQICPSAELAEHLHSEATLLRRILAVLAKEGILDTREGRDGGYRLRKDPSSVTLAEVYCALQVGDPLCYGIQDTTGSHPFGRGMRAVFEDLTQEMDQCLKEVLSRYTVADLAKRAAEGGLERLDAVDFSV